ncbi:RNA-binding transcriptional accessory protein [Candidatus Kaiserbacteria bacterium RIFCSPHIGHO2_02_FULL_49_34]|uniref:RNA-binding transcriptional accessory protein n=1 Tax=Candidatus Kaiserbacteria bacterium RIFCSPHIGHO2_02_FULL_49_34 TaxID=1798491 RepID=A0A1F6DKK1_9BACT|nr:MAG: RNA-binding transcriptional accessory protein [Candidatus Kaiserbacteria bacterium RIFCSPHIGHO2_02_FULL_49_34]
MVIEHSIEEQIAGELGAGVKDWQVVAAVKLLDEGATVPFIARYRKEVTGGLDDGQLRDLALRVVYLRELAERKVAILKSIEEQGKLTPELRASIAAAKDKTRLEDLYAPYKPKRRTKASIAREAGLEKLATDLLSNPKLTPEVEAAKYVCEPFETKEGKNPGVADAAAALAGAQAILVEMFSENADLTQWLREHLSRNASLESKVQKDKESVGEKFADYFNFRESSRTIPSHRMLALLRGEREGMLSVNVRLGKETGRQKSDAPFNACEKKIAEWFQVFDYGRPADGLLLETVRMAWKTKIFLKLELELLAELREKAETEAIRVFAQNLSALLLASPAGKHVTMGLDPGIRTGVKVAIVDATGKVLDHATVYPHQPRNDWTGALATLKKLAEKHAVTLVSIGNGTGSRETQKLANELAKSIEKQKVLTAVVSEAGASVYSASAEAAEELPQLDVSIRGAVSIARRLQDPLAELVKIEPKAIGVGQYQHDVNQSQLADSLDAVVEDCVNAVGVDVNTASELLLARISGLTKGSAKQIVSYRDKHGAFGAREDLHKVPKLGPKAFEQAAGFLRIMQGKNPLDASAVHPESYGVVEKILTKTKSTLKELMGDTKTLRTLKPQDFAGGAIGEPTVRDIIAELEKPGRDPRPEFTTVSFADGVEDIKDLTVGMKLQGIVTNVAAFGAFVDIGVHQDGLVHISALANTFVSDPHTIVKVGQPVQVTVLEVDVQRKRISLSMKE